MLSKTEILAKITENRERIKGFGVGRLWLFGSCVRGEQSEESDIDLVVEFEHGKKTFDNYMDLKFFLEELLGRDVDLLTVEAVKPAIKNRVWEEAVEVA